MAVAQVGAAVVATAVATQVVTASWSPGADNLLLCSVSTRGTRLPTGVTGNGLTWELVRAETDAQNQEGVAVYRAMSVGSAPSAGAVTVTVSGTANSIAAVLSEWSGVDTGGTNGSGAIDAETQNDNGGVDTNDLLVSIDTVTDQAVALAFANNRQRTYTLDSDETAVSINNQAGSGGDTLRHSVWRLTNAVSPAGTVQLGYLDSLNGICEWVVIAVALKPAGAGGGTFALAGTAAATAAMAGAIAHSYGLTGTAAASASMTGALAHAYALAGLAAATAGMTGDATISVGGSTYALAGTAAATADMSGAVGITYPLAGQANAVATLAGALAHAYSLAGQADGVATVTGTITHAYGLAGQASGSASLTGGITHTYGLAGIAEAVASMVGSLESGVITLGDAEIEFVVRSDGSIDFTIRHRATLDLAQPHEATLSDMSREHDLNDSIRPTVTFTVSDAVTDPTTVTLTVIPPDKEVETYTYAASQITKSSTGVYYRDITLDQPGVWYFRFVGTGTCVAATEGTVTVVG
jgi:hypothetical protein